MPLSPATPAGSLVSGKQPWAVLSDILLLRLPSPADKCDGVESTGQLQEDDGQMGGLAQLYHFVAEALSLVFQFSSTT